MRFDKSGFFFFSETFSLPKKAVFFLIVCFSFGACNYNYYLGQQYEKEERFEEANLEFHRAFSSDPDDADFGEAYQRTALLTVRELEERYRRFLPENLYPQAYDLMHRALVLEPNNIFFQEERKKWAKILIIGKINLELEEAGKRIGLQKKMEFMARFNTPNQDRVLRAEVNLVNGLIFAEDFLYTPTESFLVLYSINSIGINQHLLLGKEQNIRHTSFHNFVNFGTPVLSKTSGRLIEERGSYGSIFEKSKELQADFLNGNKTGNFFFPPSSIRYNIRFEETDIQVDSDANSIFFLPQAIYSNPEENIFVLDFGALDVKFFSERDRWGLQRNFEDAYMKDFSGYFVLYPYFRKVQKAYRFIKT